MEKLKHHSITGKSTCQRITLPKGKGDGSWQSATITTCLPPDASIIPGHDEHQQQNTFTGNNMILGPSMLSANSPIP